MKPKIDFPATGKQRGGKGPRGKRDLIAARRKMLANKPPVKKEPDDRSAQYLANVVLAVVVTVAVVACWGTGSVLAGFIAFSAFLLLCAYLDAAWSDWTDARRERQRQTDRWFAELIDRRHCRLVPEPVYDWELDS
jgi:NaMN:DMB phosphoribosyltransferase